MDKLHTAAEFPNGKDLLSALADLLAAQEGVSITYIIEKGEMQNV